MGSRIEDVMSRPCPNVTRTMALKLVDVARAFVERKSSGARIRSVLDYSIVGEIDDDDEGEEQEEVTPPPRRGAKMVKLTHTPVPTTPPASPLVDESAPPSPPPSSPRPPAARPVGEGLRQYERAFSKPVMGTRSCAHCGVALVDGDVVVLGCSNPAHICHSNACYDALRGRAAPVSSSTLTQHTCPKDSTPCATMSVTLTDGDVARIRTSALEHLAFVCAKNANRDPTSLKKTARSRLERIHRIVIPTREFVLSGVAAGGTLPRTYTHSMRPLVFGVDMDRPCCVCGGAIDPVDSEALSTCHSHSAHASCWAFFRYVRDAMEHKYARDCPAQMFCSSTCSGGARA